MVQRFQPTALKAPSYRDCHSVNRQIDRARQRGTRLIHDNARESTEHYFDLASLIVTAFRSVGIGKTNRDALD